MHFPARGTCLLGADGRAQWDDIIPRGTDDWATSLLWLRRLQCRCRAACFLLCVTTVLTLLMEAQLEKTQRS